jgi:hypothetical protein
MRKPPFVEQALAERELRGSAARDDGIGVIGSAAAAVAGADGCVNEACAVALRIARNTSRQGLSAWPTEQRPIAGPRKAAASWMRTIDTAMVAIICMAPLRRR